MTSGDASLAPIAFLPIGDALMSAGLEIREQDGCWHFTLDRPARLNALSAALVEALIAGVDQAIAAKARVMVFRGKGRNFSAGFDLDGLEAQSDGDLLLRFVRIETLLKRVALAPCLTLGLAQGRNFGAGADLFAACRWRVSAPEASFRMPGLRFGLVLGTRRLAALVGMGEAGAILEQGQVVTAERAARIGLAQRLVPEEGWGAVVAEAVEAAGFLPEEARRHLYQVLSAETGDADMADLVRSASIPGLQARIMAYAEASRPVPKTREERS